MKIVKMMVMKMKMMKMIDIALLLETGSKDKD